MTGLLDTARRAVATVARLVHATACGHHWHFGLQPDGPAWRCCWCPARTEYSADANDGRRDCTRPAARWGR